MPRFTRRFVHSVAMSAIWLGAGCGPFGYLKKVAKEANKSVADAKALGAEQWAPYEYWGAVSYLEQAKVMMAYSEYERSFDYGERAKQLAEEARKKSERREAGETTESDPDIARPDDDIGPQVKDAEAEAEPGVGEAESNAGVGEAESNAGVGEAEGKAGVGEAEGKVGVKLGGDK